MSENQHLPAKTGFSRDDHFAYPCQFLPYIYKKPASVNSRPVHCRLLLIPLFWQHKLLQVLMLPMKKNWLFLFAFLFLFFTGKLNAQLTVNTSATASQLVQALVGQGLTVSNINLNCPSGAYGSFTNGNTTNLGINSGILLTSGTANVGGSATNQASQCYGTTTNDPDLIALDSLANNDVCILEFDIVPKCDSLQIRFVFGSEEYPVFVNSINDLFGFFVSGPNPAGGNYTGLNIATLPVAGNPYVSINNVNNGNSNTGPCTNCQFYIDNTAGTTIMYDGMTTVLTSSLWMVPCQTYHFKIAIADASDCILDSGVFIDYLQCSTAFNFTTSSTPDQCNSCSGTGTVNMSGGIPPYTYQWLPTGGNAATATNLCAGTYSVLVQDQSSCGTPDTAIITITNQGSMTAQSTQNNATCNGNCNGSLVITPTSGNAPFTYSWTPAVSTNDTANGLCAGTYSVTITDVNGCSSQFTYTITEPVALSLSLTGQDTICLGGSTTITANAAGGTGPYTVSWSNSLPNGTSQTVSPGANTTYTATATDANGCTIQQSFSVTIAPAPVAAFVPGPGDCAPALVSFTNTSSSGTSWQWDFGDGNTSNLQNPTHMYLAGGTYAVTLIVSNGGGCNDTLTIPAAVVVDPQPTAGLGALSSTVSELDPEVTFSDLSNGGTNCVLYFGDGDSAVTCNFGSIIHTYPMAGTYTAMYIVTNASGCADTAYLTVVVEQESTVYIPNAFTPNGNGNNDIFYAYGTNVHDFDMMVFDRWGNLIFESKDILKGWDGTYQNHLCQEDVYVWRMTYTDSHGKRMKLIGSVSLIR
jgi:gliding motility-associated-like protein